MSQRVDDGQRAGLRPGRGPAHACQDRADDLVADREQGGDGAGLPSGDVVAPGCAYRISGVRVTVIRERSSRITACPGVAFRAFPKQYFHDPGAKPTTWRLSGDFPAIPVNRFPLSHIYVLDA